MIYQQGQQAFLASLKRGDNPYCVTAQRGKWLDWDAGYYDAATRMEG